MADYRMNTPVIAGRETIWYKMLKSLYRFNKPVHKKEWLFMTAIPFSDKKPKITKTAYGSRSKWSYRHWRGLYPAMFKQFQWMGLVHYNCKTKMWYLHKPEYRALCKQLSVKP